MILIKKELIFQYTFIYIHCLTYIVLYRKLPFQKSIFFPVFLNITLHLEDYRTC